MSPATSPHFEHYRTSFAAKPPILSLQQFEDELTDLTAHNDVFTLTVAPAERSPQGEPPRRQRARGDNMHLWLITPEDVVAALEEGEAGQSTKRGRLAHTNLCGGHEAHAGGELWFDGMSRIWLTGGSSRYQPRNSEEFEDIVKAFRLCGYTVCSCGWDDENDGPARFFRGQEEWLEPYGE